jgi:GNAT superfamily N-acetyltransferase
MQNIEIRLLSKSDSRDRFRSGNDELDTFLRDYAGQSHFRHHVAVTHVAVIGQRIVGYATVTSGSLEPEGNSGRAHQKPVLLLARMAIDSSLHRQGVGTALLGHVCRLAAEMAINIGCVGVVVDPKPDSVSFYYKYDFRAISTSTDSGKPPRMFLPIKTILAALDGEPKLVWSKLPSSSTPANPGPHAKV